MQGEEKIAFKNRLKQFCQSGIEARINAAKQAILLAQDAANSEEKSSAGDKYETGRAMGHLQKDMHARQLAEYIKELSGLQGVTVSLLYDTAGAGAFVETAAALFFIAAGMGKQIFEEQVIYFLSPHAPLAALLKNKKRGDNFYFNSSVHMITEVY